MKILEENHIAHQIFEILKRKSEDEFDYINPNFLVAINDALDEYYEIGDPEVDEWIQDMFGA